MLPMSATATTSCVESTLPTARQESVAAPASAAFKSVGSIQSAPRITAITEAIGTCSQSTAINALLAISRRASRFFALASMSNFLLFNQTGRDGLRIKCQPDPRVTQPFQSIVVVRPNHQKGGDRGRSHHGGIGRGDGCKHLLRTPPRGKGYGHDLDARADVEGESGNRDDARKQQAASVEPCRPPVRDAIAGKVHEDADIRARLI